MATAEECLNSSVDAEAFEAAVNKCPLLKRKIKDLTSVEDKIKAIDDFFDEQATLREKKQAKLEEREARLFAETDNAIQLRNNWPRLRARLLASTLATKQPNPQRKQRWIELNQILQGHTKKSKLNDSTEYSYIAWNQVKSVFNLTTHDQPGKEIPDF